MIVSFVTGIAIAVAVAAIGVAFKKHKTITGIKASVLREVAYLELLAHKVDVTAVAGFQDAIARVKAIF